MASSNLGPEKAPKSPPSISNTEIESLQKLRATLEAVREATEKIYQDVMSAAENQRSISKELERTSAAIEKF